MISKYFVGLLLICGVCSLVGQTYFGPFEVDLTFSPSRNILYTGINNDFQLNSHLPLSQWEIIASNGSAKMLEGCYVKITPTKPGKDTILFYFINDEGQKKLAQMHIFHVDPLPMAQLVIGRNNKIGLSELQSLTTLIVRIPNLQYSFTYYINHCRIIIIKPTGQRTELSQNSNVISAEIKKKFLAVQKGDMIVFEDIKGIREKNETVENIDGNFVVVE